MKKTQGQQKIINYLDAFMETADFKQKIISLRKELGMPEEGFVLTEEHKAALLKSGDFGNITYLPVKLKSVDLRPLRFVNLKIKESISNFPISNPLLTTFFRLYVFYGKKFYEIFSQSSMQGIDLLKIKDMKDYIHSYGQGVPAEEVIDNLTSLFDSYPLVILMRPEATGNDIKDFLTKNQFLINSYLEGYRDKNTKLGKIRKKPAKEKYAFIEKYEGKSLNEIMDLYNKEFNEVIGYDDVGKILAILRKRRRQVGGT